MSVVSTDQAAILAKRTFAHVATIGPRGEPHSSPVWIDWDGEFLKFSQTTTRQKYRNLQRDARVSLSMIDPDNAYHYVEVRGRVERVDEDPDKAFINAMAKKYLDLDVYPWGAPGEQRLVVYVRPEHTSGM
ncbi:PPOX class F420-dependent oxidoreductase [Lipingzhangella sp. LS1_29]|uniref:PPOX class F420-dependent oxidoreductase n=1 Tax=Lipingzhangella rawalii TaxID=2055835 RepID=A0ABU2H9N2_9ACTN|nr:PPOX class F420-dependent oxidoreductase [Lipingzhangella rawalii]MDS1271993.1 PPOX class F420-dependent oxidoreductase [Lipingzhangella rawalii]